LPEGIKANEAESSQDEDDTKHKLPADFIVFSNQKIIEEHLAENERVIAQYKTYTDEARRKRDTRSQTTSMLIQLRSAGDGIWHELDFTQFDAACVFEASNNSEIATINNKSLFDMIVKGIKIQRDEQEHKFNLSQQYLQQFTIEQLDSFKSADPWFATQDVFIGVYFQKQFCEELCVENQELWSTAEKLENLERLYSLAKSQGLPKAFQRQFLEEMLTLGTQTGNYSKAFFRDYIDMFDKHEVRIMKNYDENLKEHRL